MYDKLYYYKRSNDTWVFCDGTILKAKDAVLYLYNKRKEGYEVARLYLDLPADYEFIKANFFTPEYWEGRNWAKEEAE